MLFVDMEPGDPRLDADVLPVLLELRPHLTPASFDEVYAEGHPQGLRFTALYDEDRCAAVAGWRLMASTAGLRKLYVDDLVTASELRGRGYGAELLGELESRAREAGCSALDLDSGIAREEAHRFYFREGLAIGAFHFIRRLGGGGR
jgi:GNAT superfamily N-acetyltransferase